MSSQVTAVKQNILNGVNVDKISSTVEAIKKDHEIASFKFKNRNKWITGGLNRSVIKEFDGACQTFGNREFVIDNDQPDILLSNNAAPTPFEHLLHALAGCITTTLVYHASAKGVEIYDMETKFTGDIDLRGVLGLPGAKRNGFEEIKAEVSVKADISENEIEELVQHALNRAPLFDTLTNGVPIKVDVQ
ncbi:MAG: OsmC family peroxiredoxin [Candidatus Dadabacteria bacterium]|nr:OsmC family peroxiredoxin [Candidatus Dadabacteria bacterium]NIQ17169.1 OsmC family peroxiredoxin [Candidatus Dadabacteria bacterium]